MDFAITDDVREILLTIGWTAGRQFDVAEWIAELNSRGFRILESGVLTLKVLGNLRYSNENDENGMPIVDVIFDPRGVIVQSLRDWELRSGIKLFPIGEVDGQASLLVDENDGWYLSMGGLWKIGDCPNQGLAHLFLGKGESSTVKLPG
jgi:hypothetical protein